MIKKCTSFYDLKVTFGYIRVISENVCQIIYRECEYFENKNCIFGQTIWLLHSFLSYLNTKRLISPERESFRCSYFVRFILGI